MCKTTEDRSLWDAGSVGNRCPGGCDRTGHAFGELRSANGEKLSRVFSPEEYVQRLADLFAELHRVTKPTGSAWVIIGDKVYDLSEWKDHHPGGPFVARMHAGKDATGEFGGFHSKLAKRHMIHFCVGTLID